jgi:hypothetical protein
MTKPDAIAPERVVNPLYTAPVVALGTTAVLHTEAMSFRATCRELSADGCRIETPCLLSVGMRGEVSIELPGGGVFMSAAVIARQSGHHVELRFAQATGDKLVVREKRWVG